MAQVDISNLINVNISTAPTLLQSDNINVVGIMTDETPLYPVNNYVIYKNPISCLNDWGINSEVYKMVNTIFSQNLNLLAGGGYVVVFPKLKSITVNATSGKFITENLIFELFKDVDDGSFNIAVDGGAATAITALDFTSCESLEDVATVINTSFTDNSIAATVSVEDTTLTITSNTTGSTSTIAITSNTTGTDLSELNYLNVSQATVIAGTNAYSGAERLQDIVVRTQSIIFYEVILPTFQPTDDEIITTAALIQPLNKMLFVCSDDLTKAQAGGLFDTIRQRKYTKTRCFYNGMGQGNLLMAGIASKLLSINFNGTGTAANLNAKELVGVDMDTTINDTIYAILKSAGVDFYCSIKGLGTIISSGANEYIDTVLFLNWLKMSLEVAGFNALRNTPTKQSLTDEGVIALVNAYKGVLARAVLLNFVAPGKWLQPFTFGNQELFYNNVRDFGYYVYYEPIDSLTQEQRDKREAPLIQIAVKLGGAINSSDVNVFVNN